MTHQLIGMFTATENVTLATLGLAKPKWQNSITARLTTETSKLKSELLIKNEKQNHGTKTTKNNNKRRETMTSNSHLRNNKDFNLMESYMEWKTKDTLAGMTDGEVSHCCEAPVNDVSGGWGRCSHCHEMAEVLNTADFD
jgi:hypothetical protein